MGGSGISFVDRWCPLPTKRLMNIRPDIIPDGFGWHVAHLLSLLTLLLKFLPCPDLRVCMLWYLSQGRP